MTSRDGTCFALAYRVYSLVQHRARRNKNMNQRVRTESTGIMEQPLTMSTKQQLVGRPSATKTTGIRLRLTALVAALLLTMIPLLTGCGPGEQNGSGGSAASVSLDWQSVQDPSVIGYFVRYGRQSPGEPGSCNYESSLYVTSSSATVENLDPNTLYYFTVSAYNGLESPCSEEVSTVTDPPSQIVPFA
jgi:hypothetical protein